MEKETQGTITMTAKILTNNCAKCGKRCLRDLCSGCDHRCQHCNRRMTEKGSVCTRCKYVYQGKRAMYKAMGLCADCGKNEPTPGYKSCQPCREHANEKATAYRENRRKLGLCIRCPNRAYGSLCDSCAGRQNTNRRHGRPPKYAHVDAAILAFLGDNAISTSDVITEYIDKLGLLEDIPPSKTKMLFVGHRLYDLKKRDMVSRTWRLWRIEKGN